MNNQIPDMAITTLILAGGRGSRMGGRDKGLIPISGKPAIEHILECLQTWSTRIIISANRNLTQYASYGYPVVEDSIGGFPGPLAGILAGLDACDTRLLLTVPVDTPFISGKFLVRMKASMEHHDDPACVAEYNGQIEPMFCLLDRNLRGSLREFLDQEHRSAKAWLKKVGARPVDCSDIPDQFINLNRAEDLYQTGQLHIAGD